MSRLSTALGGGPRPVLTQPSAASVYGIQLTSGFAREIHVIVKEMGRRRNLRDACQRLTHHFYPQGWVVCGAIEISLTEGAVAAS